MAEVQAVLLARFPVARLVHEGLPFHGADAQAADDDVDVDVPGTVVTVRGGCRRWRDDRGSCPLQNCKPRACARSMVRPFSTASFGSKLMI